MTFRSMDISLPVAQRNVSILLKMHWAIYLMTPFKVARFEFEISFPNASVISTVTIVSLKR